MGTDSDTAAQANTENQKQPDPESQNNEKKKKSAEEQKANVEALKEILNTYFPAKELKGLEGTITVNKGAGYYAEVLTYKAIQNCINTMVSEIELENDSKLFIISGAVNLANEAMAWKFLQTRLKDTNENIKIIVNQYPAKGKDFINNKWQELENLIAPEHIEEELATGYQEAPDRSVVSISPSFITNSLNYLGMASKAIPAILGVAEDIAALFKKDIVMDVKEMTVNEQFLVTEIASQIHKKNKTISIILPYQDITGEGVLTKLIDEILQNRRDLVEIKKNIIIEFNNIFNNTNNDKQNNPENDKRNNQPRPLTILQSEKENIIKEIDQMIEVAEKLVAAVTNKTEGALSPLESVANIEKIKKYPKATLLIINIISHSAEYDTIKRVFGNGYINYRGGAVVSYVLTDVTGKTHNSGNTINIKSAKSKKKNKIIPALLKYIKQIF